MIFIFDLDGTLVDSFLYHYYTTKEALKQFGIELSLEEFKKLFGIDASGILMYFGIEPSEENLKRFKEVKRKVRENYKDKIKLFDGVKEFLEELKRRGIKVALLSNSMREEVEFILKSVGIFEFFDLILGADDIKPKPNPEGILKIMEYFGDKDVVYIGDKEIDEETAKRAGVKFLMFGRDFKDYKNFFMNPNILSSLNNSQRAF